MRYTPLLAAIWLLASCAGQKASAPVYTLYRNSELIEGLRVHWATFNAVESAPYNRKNCEMAARLLNANLQEVRRRNGGAPVPRLGFWCEAGSYEEKGSSPSSFNGQFPTEDGQ